MIIGYVGVKQYEVFQFLEEGNGFVKVNIWLIQPINSENKTKVLYVILMTKYTKILVHNVSIIKN